MEHLYNRQKNLHLDIDQSICVIGAGGIGYWVCKYAALTGISTIHVFDPDILEETNLNRIDVPLSFIGKNKADVAKIAVSIIRPYCDIISYPFKFQSVTNPGVKWIIDCTDNFASQIENQKIANESGSSYIKSGYDGESFSINESVAEWGEVVDGYQITPSWVVPASIVAALTIAKIVKYNEYEVASNIKSLMTNRGNNNG